MRKSKSSTVPKKLLSWGQMRDIWSAAPAQEWLEFFQQIAPDRKWSRNGPTVSCTCPYHSENTPSMKLNFDKKLGKCFGCGKTVTDIIQFTSSLLGQQYMTALITVNNTFKLDAVIQEQSQEIAKQHDIEEMKKETAVAFGKLADEYVRDHPDYLKYMDIGAAYLEKGRNVPMHLVSNLPVGILGKPEHVKKYISEGYHKSFDEYFKDAYHSCEAGSIVFWYNDSPGMISNFKIRKLGKVRSAVMGSNSDPFQLDPQAARNLVSKEYFVVKDTLKRPIGVYGLNHYSRLISDSVTQAVITEGEFDALSVMVGQLKDGAVTDFPIFAGGGGAATSLSFLRDCWIRTLLVVTDTPGIKRGTEVAYNWMTSPDNHLGDAVNAPIEYKMFMWETDMSNVVGDLDDAMQHFGYAVVKQRIWDEVANNYLSELPWAQEMCSRAIKELDNRYENDKQQAEGNALANLKAEHDTSVRKTLAYWLKAVWDNADKNTFIAGAKNFTGVDMTADDSSLYTKVNNLNTMLGAAKAVEKAFFEVASIPYYKTSKSTIEYTVYSRRHQETSTLQLNKNATSQTFLNKCVGMDLTEWMKLVLHNAVTITPSPEELEEKRFQGAPNVIRDEEIKRADSVMRLVLNTHSATCDDLAQLVKVGQGIHYRDIANNKHLYFVNGVDIYKGIFSPASGAAIEWVKLNDIRDGRYVFEPKIAERWSYTVNDVQDLYAGGSVNLHDVYELITKVLDGWLFENHDIMRRYVASWILSIPIQLAIQKVNVTFITGESTSGKTSFAQGLLGGSGKGINDIPSILEPANVVTDSSSAFIYQSASGSSALINIDEAETEEGSEHNSRMQEIVKMLYSIPTGGSRIGRGTPSNEGALTYTLQAPVLCAAIKLPEDDIFLTRIMVIYTKKDYTRRNICNVLPEILNQQQAYDLRKAITTCLLSRIPAIMTRVSALESELSKIQTDPPVTSRFIAAVSAALTIYEMCGTEEEPHDPVELFKGLVTSNKSRLETVYTADAKSNLLDTVLFTRCVSAFAGPNNTVDKVSPRDMLVKGDRDSVTILNNSGCGVYCLLSRRWIVFYWRQIKTAILGPAHSQYRSSSEGSLRNMVSKNRYLVNGITKKKHAEITEALGLVDAKTPTSYSVIDMAYLIDTEEEETAPVQDTDDDLDFNFDI